MKIKYKAIYIFILKHKGYVNNLFYLSYETALNRDSRLLLFRILIKILIVGFNYVRIIDEAENEKKEIIKFLNKYRI